MDSKDMYKDNPHRHSHHKEDRLSAVAWMEPQPAPVPDRPLAEASSAVVTAAAVVAFAPDIVDIERLAAVIGRRAQGWP
jgi:hypothetical protein